MNRHDLLSWHCYRLTYKKTSTTTEYWKLLPVKTCLLSAVKWRHKKIISCFAKLNYKKYIYGWKNLLPHQNFSISNRISKEKMKYSKAVVHWGVDIKLVQPSTKVYDLTRLKRLHLYVHLQPSSPLHVVSKQHNFRIKPIDTSISANSY